MRAYFNYSISDAAQGAQSGYIRMATSDKLVIQIGNMTDPLYEGYMQF